MTWQRLARTLVPLSLLTLALVAPPAPVSAATWNDASQSQAPDGSPLRACLHAAQQKSSSAWTCLGGELTTIRRDSAGKYILDTIVVDSNPPTETASSGPVALAATDDYDSWCENGTTCTRKISDYTAEVKGNAAYGDLNGVIGTFDQIMRQNFQGSVPTWRMTMIWDSGPAINGNNWHTRCRKNQTGPDGVCGDNPYDPAVISSASWRYYFPSQNAYVWNSQTLSGTSTKYHDENYGYFTASGYSQTWGTGTLHTGRWNNCPNCKYYQIPWTSSP